jgi:glutaredoxin
MIVKALREGLGRLIVLISFITRPKRVVRSAADQESVDKRAAHMALYQFYGCPFCVRVRREMHRLNLPIETRDAQNDPPFRRELLEEGGKVQTPCLLIEEDGKRIWMYESKEIIDFLKKSFDPAFDPSGAKPL